MRFSKTKGSNMIRIFFVLLVACLFMTIGAYAQSQSKIETQKLPKQVVSKGSQDLKMVADVLDAVGGKSESADFKMRMSAGGQPSAIGKSQSTSFKTSAGYVGATFVQRGDATADGGIDAADVVYLINYLYIHGPAPIPLEAGDVDCDGVINAADVVYLINYLYIKGPPPCA